MNGWLKTGAAVAGAAAGAYAGLATSAYARYGRVPRRDAADRDDLLDRFIPSYDVFEHHAVVVEAPPDVTLAAARDQDILGAPLIRTIFRAREVLLRSRPVDAQASRGLLASTLAIGWRTLAETSDEIVVGAVTRPWEADVTFRGLPPEDFRSFDEPDYVKIAWTLRADSAAGGRRTRFSTETRAVATDTEARNRFRVYWAFVSPGIWMIRQLAVRDMKRAAEHAMAAAPLRPPFAPSTAHPR